MKKRMLSLAAALMLAVGPALGQVIITDGDYNRNRGERSAEEVSVMVPGQGMDVDQWKMAPIGDDYSFVFLKRRRHETSPFLFL